MAKSRLQHDESICYICNKPLTTRNLHHIFNGSMKRKSEEDSMIIYVHPNCHMLIHNDAQLMHRLKEKAQEVWEDDYMAMMECDLNEARFAFISRYGKSYL